MACRSALLHLSRSGDGGLPKILEGRKRRGGAYLTLSVSSCTPLKEVDPFSYLFFSAFVASFAYLFVSVFGKLDKERCGGKKKDRKSLCSPLVRVYISKNASLVWLLVVRWEWPRRTFSEGEDREREKVGGARIFIWIDNYRVGEMRKFRRGQREREGGVWFGVTSPSSVEGKNKKCRSGGGRTSQTVWRQMSRFAHANFIYSLYQYIFISNDSA